MNAKKIISKKKLAKKKVSKKAGSKKTASKKNPVKKGVSNNTSLIDQADKIRHSPGTITIGGQIKIRLR